MSTRIFHVYLDKHPRAPIALHKSVAAWPQDGCICLQDRWAEERVMMESDSGIVRGQSYFHRRYTILKHLHSGNAR